jgi:hypothetical protein
LTGLTGFTRLEKLIPFGEYSVGSIQFLAASFPLHQSQLIMQRRVMDSIEKNPDNLVNPVKN